MNIKDKYNKVKRYLRDAWVRNSEISTIFYKTRLWYLRNFGTFHRYYRFKPVDGYKLKLNEDFLGDGINKLLWRVGQIWGKVHPKYPEQYSGEEGIFVRNSVMKLFNRYRPKEITQYEGTDKERTFKPERGECLYVHGDISAKETFTYGVFEIRCRLPKGEIGWPAFWLGMDDKEEVDFFEFFPNNIKKRVVGMTTTYHWPDGTDREYPKGGSMSPKIYKLPNTITDQFNVYTFEWTPDKLVFMFNGVVIRKITRKSIVKRYRGKKARLNITQQIDYNSYPEIPGEIPLEIFEIDYVKVWQKETGGIGNGYTIR